MKTEMKASNECLYPTDVFLVSCGMGCKRITVSDIAYIEAMKDNCIIHIPQFGITECIIRYKCSVNTPPPHAIRSG